MTHQRIPVVVYSSSYDIPKFARGGLHDAARKVARAGRHGDSRVVHVNESEFNEMRRRWGEPTLNPQTGMPEYFKMGSILKYAIPAAAAVFAPELGTALFGESLLGSTALPAIVAGGGLGALGAGFTGGNVMRSGALGALGAAAMPYVKEALAGIGSPAGVVEGAETFGSGAGLIESTPSAPMEVFGEDGWSWARDYQPHDWSGIVSAAPEVPAPITAAIPVSGQPLPMPPTPRPAPEGLVSEIWKKYKVPIAAGTGLMALQAMNSRSQQPGTGAVAAVPVTRDTTPLQPLQLARRPVSGTRATRDWYTFGERAAPISPGGGRFFENVNVFEPAAARGGLMTLGDVQGMAGAGYVGRREMNGDGRSDGVPARLSNNEFVMDAETVSLLGDGDPDAGARKLEEMRKAVRRKKGAALSKGRFSPKSPGPLELLRKAD